MLSSVKEKNPFSPYNQPSLGCLSIVLQICLFSGGYLLCTFFCGCVTILAVETTQIIFFCFASALRISPFCLLIPDEVTKCLVTISFSITVLQWTTREKRYSWDAWHARISWGTWPWWTWRNQGRPGQSGKGWAPRTSWPSRKQRLKGRVWCPGSHRSKGTARGKRQEWKCRGVSAFLAYELERMYMEERKRHRLGSDPSKSNLTVNDLRNLCL